MPSEGPIANSQEASKPLGEKRQVASRSNPLSSVKKEAAVGVNACPLSISRTKEYSEGDARSPKRKKLVDNPGARPPENAPLAYGERDLPDAAEPWDKLRGEQFDVFAHEARLHEELDASASEHFAPNCATFSRARERPIAGASNAPVPLRSLDYPKGLTFLQQPKWRKTRKRVERDTDMAVTSAVEALKCHRSGRPFSLEHPGRSIARALPEWRELEREPGVKVTLHHH